MWAILIFPLVMPLLMPRLVHPDFGGAGVSAQYEGPEPILRSLTQLPICADVAGVHLSYNQNSNTFSCGMSK